MIELKSCPKGYTKDLDKAVSPEKTVKKIKAILEKFGQDVLLETRRIDSGRLGIPVFFSVYGKKARGICPSRKQMGKGASPSQAEASAVMELVERYSFFSFWENRKNFITLRWSDAKKKFKDIGVISEQEILKSVQDTISIRDAVSILDLIPWRFTEAVLLNENIEKMVPMDWFKKLNEYNGSSAGNTFEESILQGGCELVERHVSAIIDRQEKIVPTIDLNSITHPVLEGLIACFKRNNIHLWLKDFSLDMGVPTVGALAYDPSTFPHKSEIVFTAGTATSPIKAAIRALTEVAQLAGDFHTSSKYEPSGLRKFRRIEEVEWVIDGDTRELNSLPDISENDIYTELMNLVKVLGERGYNLYSIDTTHPEINVPCNFNFVPGFYFRERSRFPSLGLFVGRTLVEEMEIDYAEYGLQRLESIYGKAYFIPFFKGMLFMKKGELESGLKVFENSLPIQPGREEKAIVLFYMGNILVQKQDYRGAIKLLDQTIDLVDDSSIYYNLRGVCHFKLGEYEDAKHDFVHALDIDRGSAMDLANLGLCYKMLKRYDEARSCLIQALELDPSIEFAKKHLMEIS